jgi:hypothetical protein
MKSPHVAPSTIRTQVWPMALLLTALIASAPAFAQDAPAAQTETQTKTPEGAAAPVLNVDAGPCMAEFTVRDASGKGVYDAKITMHVEYGFLGMRKLDLNVGTNYEGKATIEGLPQKTRKPAEFKIAQGGREKTVAFDPVIHCYAQHQVVLDEPAANTPQQ